MYNKDDDSDIIGGGGETEVKSASSASHARPHRLIPSTRPPSDLLPVPPGSPPGSPASSSRPASPRDSPRDSPRGLPHASQGQIPETNTINNEKVLPEEGTSLKLQKSSGQPNPNISEEVVGLPSQPSTESPPIVVTEAVPGSSEHTNPNGSEVVDPQSSTDRVNGQPNQTNLRENNGQSETKSSGVVGLPNTKVMDAAVQPKQDTTVSQSDVEAIQTPIPGNVQPQKITNAKSRESSGQPKTNISEEAAGQPNQDPNGSKSPAVVTKENIESGNEEHQESTNIKGDIQELLQDDLSITFNIKDKGIKYLFEFLGTKMFKIVLVILTYLFTRDIISIIGDFYTLDELHVSTYTILILCFLLLWAILPTKQSFIPNGNKYVHTNKVLVIIVMLLGGVSLTMNLF